MEVTSPERTKLLAMIGEKDDFKKKLNATKLKCQQSKCKVQKKKTTFRHRFALRFKGLLARDMKTAKSHILKVFKGVLAVTFLTASKIQNHFNGWIFFDWKINLMLAQSKKQRKKSRKLCYMEFIKIEINGYERQPLFEMKKVYVKKQWNRSQVRRVMEKFQKRRKKRKKLQTLDTELQKFQGCLKHSNSFPRYIFAFSFVFCLLAVHCLFLIFSF